MEGVKTKDIVTDKTIAPHLLHVEVYSPTSISGLSKIHSIGISMQMMMERRF